MKEKELKKIDYILSKIKEYENSIFNIENKIIEDDLNIKSMLLEFVIFLGLIICFIFMMFFLAKYILLWIVLIFIISTLFLLYFLSFHKENREKEKTLNNLIIEKMNLENILENMPEKKILIKNKNKLLNKE